MAFDELGILRGKYTTAVIDLEPTEAAAVSLTVNSDGAKCLDIRQTGAKGLAAVMVVPAEATTYADTLTAIIEASNALDRGWETIAAFPVLHALMRKIKVIATTAFVAADIAQNIVEGTTSGAGLLLAFDDALLAIDGVGYCLFSMIDSADLFDSLTETVTSAGTGVGTEQGELGLVVPVVGVSIARFATDKRYIRGKYTVSTGGNFGKVEVMVAAHPFKNL